jgi:uncharacterized protein YfdQ (DUF2303 family)
MSTTHSTETGVPNGYEHGGARNETQAAINAGVALAEPREVEGGQQYAVAVPAGGKLVHLNLDTDEYRERPRRKTGTVHVHDAKGFVDYLAKHGLAETEVFADLPRQALVAVINAHTSAFADDGNEGEAGWSDHRVQLELVKSEGWKAWTQNNGKLLSQVDFAELIEARAIDMVHPTAAEMLELAQTFEAKKDVEFLSSSLLDSGQRQLVFKETTTAKSGQRGDIEIPKEFELGLSPFEGGDPYRVIARFRYRITGEGRLLLGYVLTRPEDVNREAFSQLVTDVADNVDHPVFKGRPA